MAKPNLAVVAKPQKPPAARQAAVVLFGRDPGGKVRAFDGFSADNDPYGEHDFGAIEHTEVGRIFWKIDYYDRTLSAGSRDPADPQVTCRVLTIMLADEY